MLEAIVPALGFGFVAGALPGPLQSFLLVQTLQRGLRGGAWILPAPLLSGGPIIAVCLLLLSQAGPQWLRGLSLIGGLFLLYLAWESWRKLRKDEEAVDELAQASAASYAGPALTARAALINGLGPGPWLFWGTVMGPLLIQQWNVSPGRGLASLAAFYFLLIGMLTVQLLIFSFARRRGPKIVRIGTWLGIGMLLVFAVLLVLYGVGVIDRYSL